MLLEVIVSGWGVDPLGEGVAESSETSIMSTLRGLALRCNMPPEYRRR